MKKNLLYLFIFFVLNLNFIAYASYQSEKTLINNNVIKKNLNCNDLVRLLGGLNKIELLWLGNLKQEKFQYALINSSEKSNQKIFYLCENSYDKKISSKDTMQVLSERNILDIYYNSYDLFTDIFSITSKESRNYIMSTLNLRSFNITKNDLNKAYIEGLMILNEKSNPAKEKKLAEKREREQKNERKGEKRTRKYSKKIC